ncbi:Transposon Tf2-6 poly [Paramuricea clavata]|uniref:Transposon Tf2-6 poly n=1 Tax=Paramuricea clavata TaxID=317549 RepID=A0A6S7GJ55_PARCT|nr:Transposon Tf2-6 poly [Paramuricea clavata]
MKGDGLLRSGGLVLSPKWPWLGCSPDGVVVKGGVPVGCVKIKCPYASKDLNISESVHSSTRFVLKQTENSWKLQEKHAYYYQCQGVVNIDFVVYTNVDICMWREFTKIFLCGKIVERRYSHTEKEALGLVWACERFHVYLYGSKFALIIDHKPLEVIYSKNSTPPARIQRWVLHLQLYDFTDTYRPGMQNIADTLSRLTMNTRPTIDAEDYIRFVAKNAVPNAITIQEVEKEPDKDPELSKVRSCILTDHQWESVDVAYRSVRQEVSVLGKLIICGMRLVIPKILQKKVLNLAHEGHQGIVKTRQCLRSKVGWPNIDKEAEKVCCTCHGCQVVQLLSRPEPMVRTCLPESPWEIIACDSLGPTDNNI